MFWKKKTYDAPLVEHENETNRRMSFRLDTDVDNLIFATFGTHRVLMRNISAGGLSFDWNPGRIGDRQPVHLTLPGRKGFYFSAEAEILTRSEPDTCHCRFVDLNDELEEKLHQYVHHAQLFRLRRKRWERSRQTGDPTGTPPDQNSI